MWPNKVYEPNHLSRHFKTRCLRLLRTRCFKTRHYMAILMKPSVNV